VLALSEDTLATCLVQWPMRQARLEVAAQVSPYSTAPSTRQVGGVTFFLMTCLLFSSEPHLAQAKIATLAAMSIAGSSQNCHAGSHIDCGVTRTGYGRNL
jgi:hypothetical protein